MQTADTLAPAAPEWLNPPAAPQPAPTATAVPAWLMPEPTDDEAHDGEANDATHTVGAQTEPTVAVSARDRLADLEAQAEPLRTRLAEVEAARAALDAPADLAMPLPDVLAQKRAARDARVELGVEREVVASILDPLEAQVAAAKAEAANAERASARAMAVAKGLAGLETVAAAVEVLAQAVAELHDLASADRQKGISWDFIQELHAAGREANKPLSAAQTKLRSIFEF